MSAGTERLRVPFGPVTVKVEASRVTWTPDGRTMGFFPILLMGFDIVGYHSSNNTSPPTFSLRAWAPVITPFGVDTTERPNPDRTGRISLAFVYIWRLG